MEIFYFHYINYYRDENIQSTRELNPLNFFKAPHNKLSLYIDTFVAEFIFKKKKQCKLLFPSTFLIFIFTQNNICGFYGISTTHFILNQHFWKVYIIIGFFVRLGKCKLLTSDTT